jgi:hypothetical protein
VSPTDDDVKVRREVAVRHGLNWRHAKFLSGETMSELEQSAASLAELLGKKRKPDEPEHELGLYERAAIAKAERQRTLLATLSGRTPQPRDEPDASPPAAGSTGAHDRRGPWTSLRCTHTTRS